MKIIAALPFFGISMLLASDIPGTPSVVVYALQGGALAVLAWMVWYLLTRTFPAHTEALKEQRDAFLKALQDERKEMGELMQSFKKQ